MSAAAGVVRARGRAVADAAWLPWAAIGVVLAGCGALLLWAGRDGTFFFDDWTYLLYRRDWTLDAVLEPHNEHLQAVSALVYKLLFETVGLRDYWVFQLFLVLANLLTGFLLFLYGRTRIGPWPSIALVGCLVLMASSWYNLVWAFMLCFTATTAAGLGAFLAFDRRSTRGDLLGMGCLCVAVASSSAGLAFLAGAIVEWVLRDDRRRRWWVVGVPLVLYGIWRLAYDPASSARWHNVPDIPAYVLDGYDDSVAGITGLGLEFGSVLAVALAALVVRDLVDPARTSTRLIALVAMPLSFWAATALGRADMGVEADANRYLYVSGLMVGLVAIEVGRRYPLTRRGVVALTAILTFGAFANGNGVEGGGDRFRDFSGGGRPAATAYEIAGFLNPDFNGADPTFSINARDYLAAAGDYGPAGYSAKELRTVHEQQRLKVDTAISRVVTAQVVELPDSHPIGEAPPELVASTGGPAVARGGCQAYTPGTEGDRWIEVRLPAPGLIVHAGDEQVELRLRRFGPLVPEAPVGAVAANRTGGIEIAPDHSPQPWIVRLQSSAAFEACSSVPR
ncbi:MAG TPA: hypothetical protein VF529_18685 [Solirubrobacteraceae bacterium]